MPQSDEYGKKKRKKNPKKEENFKKKIKSNHLVIQCICLLTQIKAIVPSGGVQVPRPSRPRSLSRRVTDVAGGQEGLVSPQLCGRTGAAHACTYCISIYAVVQSSQATVLQALLIY